MPNAMPEHGDTPNSTVSPSPSSLIHTPVQTHQKAHAPALLWILVLITLVGAGFLGYMAYSQQNSLAAHSVSLKAYQDNLKQWTDQVNTLQTAVQELRTQVSAMPTVSAMPSMSGLPNFMGIPLNGSFSFGGTDTGGDDHSVSDDDDDTMKDADGAMFDDNDDSPATSDPNSLSNGQLTPEDEQGMVNTYLTEIKAGQHKTAQPDGITMFKSRQVSSDGSVTYDIFNSTTEENSFYIYVRQGTGVQPGWFGPFAAFPGS